MGAVLLALGVSLVALVAVLLVMPVGVDLDIDSEARRVEVHVRWLGLAWTPRIKPGSRATQPRPTTGDNGRETPRNRRMAMAVIRTPGMFGRVRRLGADVLRSLRPDAVSGVVEFGLDDPADTAGILGVCWGVGWPALATGPVRLAPEFDGDERLVLRLAVRWRVRPGGLLWPVLTFGVSPVVWRAAWAGVRARRGRKAFGDTVSARTDEPSAL